MFHFSLFRFSIVGACRFNGRHFSAFHTVPTSALADGVTLVNTFIDYRRALHIPQFGALDLTLSRAESGSCLMVTIRRSSIVSPSAQNFVRMLTSAGIHAGIVEGDCVAARHGFSAQRITTLCSAINMIVAHLTRDIPAQDFDADITDDMMTNDRETIYQRLRGNEAPWLS